MVTTKKDPVIVILQLTGGNDYFNTIIPYNDSNYYDNRPGLKIAQEDMLTVDEEFAMHPSMGPMGDIYKKGDMAIIHGVGYANSPRSHFRSMDIWHTAEPDKVGTEGWLGRAVRELDPSVCSIRGRPLHLWFANLCRTGYGPRKDASPIL